MELIVVLQQQENLDHITKWSNGDRHRMNCSGSDSILEQECDSILSLMRLSFSLSSKILLLCKPRKLDACSFSPFVMLATGRSTVLVCDLEESQS